MYKTRERIGKLTPDSLELVTQDGPPRLAFLYLNTKSIKKLVTPEVAPDKKKLISLLNNLVLILALRC